MEKEIKRQCQGCKKILDRKNLIKITKLKTGFLKINPNSKELGRSIYVCQSEECVKNLFKKKRIEITLKYNNKEEIEKIGKILTAMVNQKQPMV